MWNPQAKAAHWKSPMFYPSGPTLAPLLCMSLAGHSLYEVGRECIEDPEVQ